MKFAYLLSIPIALSACAEVPDLVSSETLAPAADTQAQIRPVHGLALLNDFQARPVGDPEDWRRLNDDQSPASGGTN